MAKKDDTGLFAPVNGSITPGQRFERLEGIIDRLTDRVRVLELKVVFFCGGVVVITPIVTAFLIRLMDKIWKQ